MNNHTFSIIVPTLNSSSTLEKTLDSIYSQTLAPSEVILIDGFSTDNTVSIFNSYKRTCDRVVSVPRSGPYGAMNIGIDLARYEVVAILNSDDYWISPDILQFVSSIYNANERTLAVVHGDIQVKTQAGESKGIIKPSTDWERYCGLGLPFCHPATFIRRETYLLYGKYNWMSFPRQADRDLGFRLSRYKVKCAYIPKVLTIFSTGGLSCVTYDKNETLMVINTLPPIRRLIGQVLGMVTSLHPKYYSGYLSFNTIKFIKELLGDLLRRVNSILFER